MSRPKHSLPRPPWSSHSLWKPTPSAFAVLVISLLTFGVGDGFLVLSQLGSTPWTVLAQGLSLKTETNIGIISFIISVIVMLTWIPFRQKPGLGTVLNISLIALSLGLTVTFIPAPQTFIGQLMFMLIGVIIGGITSAFYLTCHMGAGPRDGLMVGLYQTTGLKIGTIRTLIEGSVCFVGWLLGGVVGLGTLFFALSIGWVLQTTLGLIIKKLNSR